MLRAAVEPVRVGVAVWAGIALAAGPALPVCADGGWTVVVAVDGSGELARSAAEKVAGLRAAGGGRIVCGAYGPGAQLAGRSKAEWLTGLVAQGARRARGGPLVIGVCGHGDGSLGGVAGLLSGDGTGLTARQLAAAIGEGLAAAGRETADLVVLEICRSAAVEVAVELESCAHLCALVAGELARPGLEWASAVRQSLPGGDAPLSAEGFVERLVGAGEPEGGPVGGLVLVDLARIDELSAALADMVGAAQSESAAAFWALGDLWGRRSVAGVHDIGVADFCRRLGEAGRGGRLETAAERAAQAARRAQQRGWRLGGETPWSPGLTVYVPAPLGADLRAYDEACGLPQATGYGRLLEAYERHCRQSLPVSCL